MKKQALVTLVVLVVICLSSAYGSSFKIAVLPDTQNYVEDPLLAWIFTQQTNWIVTNKTSQSIAFVTHLGDIVQNGASDMAQWTRADTSMDVLDGQLPYSVSIGNHDYNTPADKNEPNAATVYQSYFGSSRYSGYTWYKGASQRGLSHYQIFTAGGRQWLHFNLEWEPDLSVLMWAQNIIDANPTLPVIISTHAFKTSHDPNDPNSTGLRSGTAGPAANGGYNMWHKFVQHNDQIIMTLNGHYDLESHITLQNVYDHNVFIISTDYQGRDNGGDGWMNLIEFDDTNNQINVKTYSPKLGTYETDANSQYSFGMNFSARLSNFGTREAVNGIQAANINVIQYDTMNNSTSVAVSIPAGQKTADFNIAEPNRHSNGDYCIQVGSREEDDTMGGVLIASIAENGVDYGYGWDYYHTSNSNIWGHGQISVGVQITDVCAPDGYGGWYQYTNLGEGDCNVAVAYFPFSEFIGAHCELLTEVEPKIFSAAGNGITLGGNLVQCPNTSGLIIPKTAGDINWPATDGDRGIYDLTLAGVNSMTDGIILGCAGGNEDNFFNASPYPDGHGWQLATVDNGTNGSNTECDAFSFVYVPYSTPGIVAGRVTGDAASILSGTGGFKVEFVSEGTHRLRIYGCTPADGALLLSKENHWADADEYLTYEPNSDGSWIIQNRDLPESNLGSSVPAEYVFAFIPFDGMSPAPFDGNGTPANPFKIYTKAQLEAVGYWPAASFILMNNIDLAGTTYTQAVICPDSSNANNDFDGTEFTGSFDGNGKTISNLTISAGDNDYVALFGNIGEDGQVYDLTISNAAVSTTGRNAAALAAGCYGDVTNCSASGAVSGEQYVGGLLCFANDCNVTNSSTSATVTGSLRVGGLIGYTANSTIEGCSATGNVTGNNTATDPNNRVITGGLIGMESSGSTINNCYATGTVIGLSRVGGLVGNSYQAAISNSYATGNVTGTGTGTSGDYVGGLVGQNHTTSVTGCHAGGAVTGSAGVVKVGGLVGNLYQSSITNSYATGNVTGAADYIGGFLGYNQQGTVDTCYATGNVANVSTLDGMDDIGGFVGFNEGVDGSVTAATINNCYATGSVTTAELNWSQGGFAGRSNMGSITNCHAEGAVIVNASMTSNGYYAGGFIGYVRHSNVSNCYATGNITNNYASGTGVGGFAGYLWATSGTAPTATATNCYATGTVTAACNQAGGFVGVISTNAAVSYCYAIGSVTSTNNYGAGFIGQANGAGTTVSYCYATGNANSKYETGGFGGRLSGNSIVTNCYATGSAVSSGNRAGGFGGGIYGIITNCYAIGTASAANTEVGGIGGCTNAASSAAASNCFWDTQTSGLSVSSGTSAYQVGTGKTTAQMKQQATFTNWDFTTIPVWKIRETLSYPKLAWQIFASGDIDFSDTIDIADLKLIVDDWLETGSGLLGDIHADNTVNFLDFAEFASDWVNQ